MKALRRFASALIPPRLASSMRGLGPYAVIGLLLPGGSLIALCLWLMRHRSWTALERRRILVMVVALPGMLIFPMGV
jgi:hypothetical protein